MASNGPNFIIAGCVATGTSFLSHSICHHPQIYLPKVMRPECGFFYKSWEYNKGVEYYQRRWFSDVGNEIAIGERSSLYLSGTFNHVAARIAKNYPDVKLIFCLRNPTERAFANYRFTALTGFETLSFENALKSEEKRLNNAKGWRAEIRPFANLARGLYFEQLQSFLQHFDREQILCIKSENMSADQDGTFKQVFNFLGVDEDFVPPKQESFSAPSVKSAKTQRLLRLILDSKLDDITEDFRNLDSKGILGKLVSLNLTDKKIGMSSAQREFLNDYYAKDKAQLAKLLDWELSDWK